MDAPAMSRARRKRTSAADGVIPCLAFGSHLVMNQTSEASSSSPSGTPWRLPKCTISTRQSAMAGTVDLGAAALAGAAAGVLGAGVVLAAAGAAAGAAGLGAGVALAGAAAAGAAAGA